MTWYIHADIHCMNCADNSYEKTYILVVQIRPNTHDCQESAGHGRLITVVNL